MSKNVRFALILSLGAFLFVIFLNLALSMRDSRPARFQERGRIDATAERVNEKLAYLSELDGISWVEVSGNDVYIGFEAAPSDIDWVVAGAALNGYKALGSGFHAWAVDAKIASSGWRPGTPGFICEATARYGRVKDNSC